MANYFQSLFSKQFSVNVYSNSVTKPYTFEDLTFKELEALYLLLPDVRIVEDFISDNISKIPVRVLNTRDTEVRNSPLNLLISQTNATQTWAEFIKEVMVTYGLTGNSFIKHEPKSGMFYSLPTSGTFVNLGLDKNIPEFMNYIASYRLETGGNNYPLEVTDTFHLKAATLAYEQGLWAIGTSPYQAGNKNIKTLEATYSSRVSVITKRGAMGFITNESEHPDESQTQLIKDALETYGTKEEQNKIAVTTQKLKYNQMALGVAELKLLENLDHDFDTICELRGLDPAIFKSTGSTYANQEQARKAAVKNVIIPMANKFYDKFNDFIRPFYGGLRLVPHFESMSEFGEVNTELSTKVIAEVGAGLLTEEQAMEILYPELDYIETNTQDDGNDGIQGDERE